MYFFSIIIPIYNTERFLQRCLKSILQQDFDDYEILCINDCSPGNCLDIIKEINSPKIKYIKNDKNFGTHMSRMIGVEHADSKYCLFLDSDDFYVKKTLSRLYKKLVVSNLDQLEFGYTSIPNKNKSVYQYDKNKYSILDKVIKGEKSYTNFSLCNKITRTDILKEAFLRMEKFYCIWFEDGYEQFFISSICKTFDSFKKQLLILDETSGITTSSSEITASKFLLRCENVNKVLLFLRKYINDYNLEKYLPIVYNSEDIHTAYLIQTFLPTVKKDELTIAINGLYDYFPKNIIEKNLFILINKKPVSLKKLIKIKLLRIIKR